MERSKVLPVTTGDAPRHLPIRLNLRADSSEVMGSGHISRLVPLARRAQSKGFAARFLSRELTVESKALLEANGIPWVLLLENRAPKEIGPREPLNKNPSPFSIELDAASVCQLASVQFEELLISDSYQLNDLWFEQVRDSFSVTAAIVDGNVQLESPDLVFDLTLGPRTHAYLPKLDNSLRTRQKTFTGNAFAQFSAENYVSQPNPAPTTEKVGGLDILVFNGMGDTTTVTQSLLKALSKLAKNISFRVDLVTTHSVAERMSDLGFESLLDMKILHSLGAPEYLNLCRNANLVIGSPGVSSVERTKLGVPQVLFAIADNQLELGAKLDRLGVASYGGDLRTLGPEQAARHIEEYITTGLRKFDREIGPLLFDFNGAARILELMSPSEISRTEIRAASLDDGPTLFVWSNDETTRAQSLRTATITPAEHKQWLKTVFTKDSATSLYVFTCDDLPAGHVKFRKSGPLGEFNIGYSLDPAFRGRGLAKTALKEAMKVHSRNHEVTAYVAEVREGNRASEKALASVGFIERGLGDFGVLRMIRSP